jgi:prepilin-type N-terminal cleavage/methylation domain-containing protein
MQPEKPGFTLLELILVMTLIGLLAVFAWPEFDRTYESEQLHESARRFRSLVAMCRAEAMNEGRTYRIELREDGTLQVRQQVDPVLAPHAYNPVRKGWIRTDVLLPEVWIDGLQELPEGPPPIMIIDDDLAFPEMEIEPIPIDEFERPVLLDFQPDGTCRSMRIFLRDVTGRALLLTLDGRVGRVLIEDWEPLEPDEVQRPEPLEEEEVEFFEAEDFER